MILFDADDPLVLSGVYDQEGYKPGERARIAKARARQFTLQEGDLMAKKKGTKKTKKRGTPRYRAAARRPRPMRTARTPRSQVLPGMERVRDRILDGYCEDAGEGLEQIEAGTQTVNDAKAGALARLRSRGMSSYVHTGVRFTHSPGIDKVSVRRVKEKEGSGGADEVEPVPAPAGVLGAEAGDNLEAAG